ncbi:MAG: di-heme-cytochrome C peroxidase, partial [Pseudomonadota bacterium]
DGEVTAEKQRTTNYVFPRLDAFGLIYNRVLQQIMYIYTLKRLLQRELAPHIYADVERELNKIADSSDQTNIVVRALEIVESGLAESSESERKRVLASLRSKMYNPANAPVSYPYLWDIAQHDYVQWTGLVSNGGLGPLGRNVGQVIGVFATLDWQKQSKWTLNARLGGQGEGRYRIDFKSSVNKVNLRRVENQLRTLWSPEWPEEILGPIDTELRDKGEKLFEEYCASCHSNIVRDDSSRKIVAHVSKLSEVGTDPVLAKNTVEYKGYSGLLRNQYVDGPLGKLVIEEEMPVASLVKFSTGNVVIQSDPDRLPVFRTLESLGGILKSLRDNPIKQTAKQGNYDLPTPQQPLAPVRGYKARSLNGIWATAPYLHNGSVPNLYELLLPKKRASDPVLDDLGNPIEYRRDEFSVGSREFDPKHVGFVSTGYGERQGFVFDTTLLGNSNSGHEYAAGRTRQPGGNLPRALTRDERWQLLEYLKSL